MMELCFEITCPAKSLHHRRGTSRPPLPARGTHRWVIRARFSVGSGRYGTGHRVPPASAEKRCPENCTGGRGVSVLLPLLDLIHVEKGLVLQTYTPRSVCSLDRGKSLESKKSRLCPHLNPGGCFVIPLSCHIPPERFTQIKPR